MSKVNVSTAVRDKTEKLARESASQARKLTDQARERVLEPTASGAKRHWAQVATAAGAVAGILAGLAAVLRRRRR